MKKFLLFLILVLFFFLASCYDTKPSGDKNKDKGNDDDNPVTDLDVDEVLTMDEKLREDRNLSTAHEYPSNLVDTSVMWKVSSKRMDTVGSNVLMKADGYNLVFISSLGTYYPVIKDSSNTTIFQINKPVKMYIKGSGQIEYNYDSVEINQYGILASCSLTTTNGTVFKVEDQYYYPKDDTISNVINVQRCAKVVDTSGIDTGFDLIYGINTLTDEVSNLEWFMPNEVFGSFDYNAVDYKIFRETLLGLPLVMMRDKTNGYSVSLARYQPLVENSSNSLACLELHAGKNSLGEQSSSLEVTYPTRDSSRKYFNISKGKQIVYDLTIQVSHLDSFDSAMVAHYTTQYTLENPRIVNTDIDECYKVINEDFKTFLRSTTKNGYTSYGLPWTVTIENGYIGDKSYQSGFVGQQIPCAYNMMVYGIKYNDQTSLDNGMKIIDFWVNKAKMMNESGVPKVWYNGNSNTWSGYPTFTRMAVDTMEGLLDAYRLAKTYSLPTSNWIESITACADWFVSCQNKDGSWYRCYNYEGTYYKGTESNITWNPGDICRSTSLNNSTMPVRFLGKMYELTGDVKYYNAIIKAGDFIYKNLYPKHCYYGGTCDNPDALDKEAGVYAMYAYDTLYTLTKDTKWLDCLEQAVTFTMSTVTTVPFRINENASDLKAALYAKLGYTDGLSYICCGGTSVDNYAAYIYYELFRTYIYTGKVVYYNMAEFIQQNTKSSMDWDGVLGYAYKSLTPEASTIYNFGFSSAKDAKGVQGCWLPWQSAANAEPIAKMYDVFGKADVKYYKDYKIEDLLNILDSKGVGGYAHTKF